MALAVDLAVLTVRDESLRILLVERDNDPFRGELALPGGFLDTVDDDLEAAAARELEEETGLRADQLHMEQLRVYGSLDRDPRGRVVSVCYLVFLPDLPLPKAHGAQWISVDLVRKGHMTVAFDHRTIVDDAVERARGKLEYTTLGAAFCGPEFTVSELRRVHEIVWDQQLDPRNFHRKIASVEGYLVPTGKRTARDGGRPAAVYRRGPAQVMHPPILRNPDPDE